MGRKAKVYIIVIVVSALILTMGVAMTELEQDQGIHSYNVTTPSLSTMESLIGKNLTAWTPASMNKNYTMTYYNLSVSSNSSEHSDILIETLLAPIPVTSSTNLTNKTAEYIPTSVMYNETYGTAVLLEKNSSARGIVMNGTYEGFHYFVATFNNGSQFISAGYSGNLFFYIAGFFSVPNIDKIVDVEINAIR